MATDKADPAVEVKPIGNDGGSESVSSASPPTAATENKPGFLARLKKRFGGFHFVGEIFGLVGSGMALTSVAIVMMVYDGKKLPEWSIYNFHFTINSLLAIIVTFGVTCAMIPITSSLSQLKYLWFIGEKTRSLQDFDTFDLATRGKMGSAKLLWRLRFKHLATLGALASLIALAYGSFVQNSILIDIDSEIWPDEIAELSFTQVYGESARTVNGSVIDVERTVKYKVGTALGAINDEWTMPASRCLTGNCMFPHYYTLAVCSRCEDLTSQVRVSCSSDGCNATLPNGVGLGMRDMFTMSTSAPPLVFKDHVQPLALVHSLLSFDRAQYEVLNTTDEYGYDLFVPLGDFSPWAPGDETQTLYSAHECVLYPCVQLQLFDILKASDGSKPTPRDAMAAKATMTEKTDSDIALLTVLETEERYTVGPDFRATVDFNFTQIAQNNYTMLDAINEDFYYRGQPFNLTRLYLEGVPFGIEGGTYRSLQTYLNSTLAGTVSQINSDGEIRFNTDEEGSVSASVNEIFLRSVHDDWLNWDCNPHVPFYGDVDCAMISIALGLTLAFREAAWETIDRTVVPGGTFRTIQICIAQWQYISVPIAVWVLGIALVAGTIWKTRKAQLNTWRTSPLAMLLLSLDAQGLAHLQDWQKLDDDGLRELASSVKLRLTVDENGPRFVKDSEEATSQDQARSIEAV